MGDIRKVSETRSKDDGDWDEWPYPTVTIESEVTGELRSKVIAAAGGEPVPGRVIITETEVSGGYSEFTQETEYGIEVRIDGASVWKDEYNMDSETAMSAFMRWAKV